MCCGARRAGPAGSPAQADRTGAPDRPRNRRPSCCSGPAPHRRTHRLSRDGRHAARTGSAAVYPLGSRIPVSRPGARPRPRRHGPAGDHRHSPTRPRTAAVPRHGIPSCHPRSCVGRDLWRGGDRTAVRNCTRGFKLRGNETPTRHQRLRPMPLAPCGTGEGTRGGRRCPGCCRWRGGRRSGRRACA